MSIKNKGDSEDEFSSLLSPFISDPKEQNWTFPVSSSMSNKENNNLDKSINKNNYFLNSNESFEKNFTNEISATTKLKPINTNLNYNTNNFSNNKSDLSPYSLNYKNNLNNLNSFKDFSSSNLIQNEDYEQNILSPHCAEASGYNLNYSFQTHQQQHQKSKFFNGDYLNSQKFQKHQLFQNNFQIQQLDYSIDKREKQEKISDQVLAPISIQNQSSSQLSKLISTPIPNSIFNPISSPISYPISNFISNTISNPISNLNQDQQQEFQDTPSYPLNFEVPYLNDSYNCSSKISTPKSACMSINMGINMGNSLNDNFSHNSHYQIPPISDYRNFQDKVNSLNYFPSQSQLGSTQIYSPVKDSFESPSFPLNFHDVYTSASPLLSNEENSILNFENIFNSNSSNKIKNIEENNNHNIHTTDKPFFSKNPSNVNDKYKNTDSLELENHDNELHKNSITDMKNESEGIETDGNNINNDLYEASSASDDNSMIVDLQQKFTYMLDFNPAISFCQLKDEKNNDIPIELCAKMDGRFFLCKNEKYLSDNDSTENATQKQYENNNTGCSTRSSIGSSDLDTVSNKQENSLKFQVEDNEYQLACYRRNLIHVSASVANVGRAKTILYKDCSKMEGNNQKLKVDKVKSIHISLCAKGNFSNSNVELFTFPLYNDKPSVSNTRNKNRGKQNPSVLFTSLSSPKTRPIRMSAGLETFDWKRLQFRAATANNGRKNTLQQFYCLFVCLYAVVESDSSHIPIAESTSRWIVVRGRNPSFYLRRDEVLLTRSNSVKSAQIFKRTVKANLKQKRTSMAKAKSKLLADSNRSAHPENLNILEKRSQSLNHLCSNSNLNRRENRNNVKNAAHRENYNSLLNKRNSLGDLNKQKDGKNEFNKKLCIDLDSVHTNRFYDTSSGSTPEDASQKSHSSYEHPLMSTQSNSEPNSLRNPSSMENNYKYFPISWSYYIPPVEVIYFPHSAHHPRVVSNPSSSLASQTSPYPSGLPSFNSSMFFAASFFASTNSQNEQKPMIYFSKFFYNRTIV